MKTEDIFALNRAAKPTQPDFYPRLYLDKRTGDIKIAPRIDSAQPSEGQGEEDLDYRVELDVYNGPMDLLLYLIKRDELDIYDIPIKQITDSYMGYVRMLSSFQAGQGLDINVAGDFVVMAATLMEIKSATLLPKPPPEPGKESSAAAELTDPRYELIQKLLEYKRFKDTAFALERQHQTFQNRFPRVPAKQEGNPDEPPPVDLDEVQVWDLLDAFSRLMKEVGGRKPKYHEVTYDDTPIDLHAADIEDRLKREHKISFKALLMGRKSRSEMVGVFLALLELIREKKVIVQEVKSDTEEIVSDAIHDFEILPASEEHRKTYEHASLGLASEAAPVAVEPSPVVVEAHTDAAPDDE
jgi:segregation and condensation protein A